jgi:hypothetical protein
MARLLQVRGTYNDAARLTEEMSERHGFYLAGDYAFRVEGQKSQAFEIVEQLDWRAPAAVIVPMGCGTNMAAVWKGFKEFYDRSQTVSRDIGVRAKMRTHPRRSAGRNRRQQSRRTRCSAVAAGDHRPESPAALRVRLRRDPDRWKSSMRSSWPMRDFVEPEAIPIAALSLLATGRVRADEVVVFGNGNGPKIPAALRVCRRPPRSSPR